MLQLQKCSSEEAEQRILALLQKVGRERPILIGEAALAIGRFWALEETADLLGTLVDRKLLRAATLEETRKFGIVEGFFLV